MVGETPRSPATSFTAGQPHRRRHARVYRSPGLLRPHLSPQAAETGTLAAARAGPAFADRRRHNGQGRTDPEPLVCRSLSSRHRLCVFIAGPSGIGRIAARNCASPTILCVGGAFSRRPGLATRATGPDRSAARDCPGLLTQGPASLAEHDHGPVTPEKIASLNEP